MPLISRLTLAGLLALAAASPAAAQSGYVRPYGVQRGGDVDQMPTPFSNGDTCIPQCQFDYAPCDPIYYKVADRRCNYNKRG